MGKMIGSHMPQASESCRVLLCINKCGLHLRNLKEELKVLPNFLRWGRIRILENKKIKFWILYPSDRFRLHFFRRDLRRSSLKSKDLCPELKSSGPPWSGSVSQWYGSGSFRHQAKVARKILISLVLWLLYVFCLWIIIKYLQKVISKKLVVLKVNDKGAGSDPLVRCTDQRIRIRTKMSRILNIAKKWKQNSSLFSFLFSVADP